MNSINGLSKSRIYRTYHHMIDRCCNESDAKFNNYGGRGIKVCEEWRTDFLKFYNWAIQNGYEETLTIERINVNGNYEPDNCTWIPANEQARNRTNQNIVEYNGEKHYLTEWAKMLNIRQDTLWRRIYKMGWSVEKAFSTKPQLQIKNRKCSFPGCKRKHKAKGYCELHYQKFKKQGAI